MSIVHFIFQNKVTALKIIFVMAVAIGAFTFTRLKQSVPTPSTPEILGNEVEIPVSPTAEPTKNLIKQTEEKVTAFLDNPINTAKSITNNILGETTRVLQNTASKSAETVSQTVIQSAVDTVMKQIDKLPEKEREVIKQEICK